VRKFGKHFRRGVEENLEGRHRINVRMVELLLSWALMPRRRVPFDVEFGHRLRNPLKMCQALH